MLNAPELLLAISGTLKMIRKPKPWKHPQPLTKSQLVQLREEFWDTAPHYGGRKGKNSKTPLLGMIYLSF